MIRILSTRILSPGQKRLLEVHGAVLEDYNAIKISFRKFEIDLSYDHYIFTSQNAVRSFLRAYDNLPLPEKRSEALAKSCFCVGQKTAALLVENGLKVQERAKNSKELAENISKKYPNKSFLFICGNRRRNELPQILTKNTIRYKEVISYDTLSYHQEFRKNFDGVLFYSPSGVESFATANDLSKSIAFCIGTSTEKEALQYTSNTVVAPEQRIESVLQSSANYFYPNS